MEGTELGQELWRPSDLFLERCNLTLFLNWLREKRGINHRDYADLWNWSVAEPEAFWQSIWDHFDILHDGQPQAVLQGKMPTARWFPGTRVNYAEHVLRNEATGDPNRTAIRHSSETRPLTDTSWVELANDVRRLATSLRDLGIRPGDCVASYMPNIIETVIAMLACTAIGATWSSAAPEFGTKTVIDRLGQIKPKLLFAADGYRYGGKDYNRSREISEILSNLPEIEHVVWLDYLGFQGKKPGLGPGVETRSWDEMLSGPPVDASAFRYERVTNDHPLWVLFSSGTTGLPKAIAHSHHGILLECYKCAAFHFNLKKDDCLFFYSTTGWMMWNTLLNALLMNGVTVLFDGHPSQPNPMTLWSLADEAGATCFGTNPTITQIMEKLRLRPADSCRLERLESVVLIGSPAMPDAFQWIYENVKSDVWLTSQSGGTEFCSGLLGGVPTRPVRAGFIDAPTLGVNARIFNDAGMPVTGEAGELVILAPMPSMPLFLWGDEDFELYRKTYFHRWPEVWCHGDFARIDEDLSSQVFGRSDATLNRYGVRIGAAEIYRTLDEIPGVMDSLVVCVELPGGGYYMPLFVALKENQALDDALISEIKTRLRVERSPRHVPDEIIQAPDIPVTITGKKMEIPVRRLLMGAQLSAVASEGATRNSTSLRWFAEFAKTRMTAEATASTSSQAHAGREYRS